MVKLRWKLVAAYIARYIYAFSKPGGAKASTIGSCTATSARTGTTSSTARTQDTSTRCQTEISTTANALASRILATASDRTSNQ